jgi:hypothetical protein
MIVTDLEGNLHNWSLLNKVKNTRKNISSLHKKAHQILINAYPTLVILQEIPIPLRKTETLYLDFYIPLLKTAVEVHGEQHYKFVAHFHNNAFGFIKHKKRDREKIEWCEINSIQHIELPYNESEEQWIRRIKI